MILEEWSYVLPIASYDNRRRNWPTIKRTSRSRAIWSASIETRSRWSLWSRSLRWTFWRGFDVRVLFAGIPCYHLRNGRQIYGLARRLEREDPMLIKKRESKGSNWYWNRRKRCNIIDPWRMVFLLLWITEKGSFIVRDFYNKVQKCCN